MGEPHGAWYLSAPTRDTPASCCPTLTHRGFIFCSPTDELLPRTSVPPSPLGYLLPTTSSQKPSPPTVHVNGSSNPKTPM